MAARAGLSWAELDRPPPGFRIKTCMHSRARVYAHTHLAKIRFGRLRSSFPHSEASVEYLLRVTKLPTTDMLFNKWREGAGTENPTNNRSSKDGWGDKPAVIGPGGSSKTHPKLISLSLLWSEGRSGVCGGGGRGGERRSDGRAVSRKWNSLGN